MNRELLGNAGLNILQRKKNSVQLPVYEYQEMLRDRLVGRFFFVFFREK